MDDSEGCGRTCDILLRREDGLRRDIELLGPDPVDRDLQHPRVVGERTVQGNASTVSGKSRQMHPEDRYEMTVAC
eukprot:1621085-Rhodomonas_salina.3